MKQVLINIVKLALKKVSSGMISIAANYDEQSELLTIKVKDTSNFLNR